MNFKNLELMTTKEIKLIRKYIGLRDDLMDYTMVHFDAMSYDIDGYLEEEEIDINELKKQVKAFEMMLKAYELIDYTYG
jgi:hypothetical protein